MEMFTTLGSLSAAGKERMKHNLLAYVYVAPNMSLFERLFLDRFWSWVANNLYPRWLAPNLITFMGFVFSMLGIALIFGTSPALNGASPAWARACCAFLFFVYQTFDGSDGKQARRTKSGTPLGELFDHGVDAIVVQFYWAVTAELLLFGTSSTEFLVMGTSMQASFWFSNLVLVHTGKQLYQDFDAQEAQVHTYGALALTAVLGSDIVTYRVPVPTVVARAWGSIPHFAGLLGARDDTGGSIPVNRLLYFVTTIFMFLSVVGNMTRLVRHYSATRPRSDSDVAQGKKVGRGLGNLLIQFASYGLYATLTAWAFAGARTYAISGAGSSSGASRGVLVCCFLVVIISYADIVAHMLVMRTAQLPFPRPHRSRGLFVLAVYCALLSIGGSAVQILQWVVLGVVAILFLHYCVTTGNAMCEALDVAFFTIKKKTKQ